MDPLNVNVLKDIRDLLTTKERIIIHCHRKFFIFGLFVSNKSDDSIKGESKCIESWTCPVGECGENEHWNECGSLPGCGGDDFCCPSGGTTDFWRSKSLDKAGSRSVKSLRTVF